jgi:hypothetical protein
LEDSSSAAARSFKRNEGGIITYECTVRAYVCQKELPANEYDEDSCCGPRHDARRGRGLRSALAGAEAIRAGRQLPARVLLERGVLRPVARRARCDRQADQRQLSMGMDLERQLLPAQRQPVNFARRARRGARRGARGTSCDRRDAAALPPGALPTWRRRCRTCHGLDYFR